MKTKFTKRMLSIVLALLMVITTMPFTAITSFADEIESIVWKYDAAQAGDNASIISQTNLNDSKSVAGKTSTVTVVPNGSGSYNNATTAITHIENGYAYGTINDVPADCNHWKLTFRFAYTGNQNNANVPVFAIGRSSSSVLIKVMSNGDYYISGTKIGTIANPSALNCASVDDVKTASFEYNNGTLKFNIAGVEQFTNSNPTYVINATSHFVGGLKYFATGEDANKISGMNLSKIIAASSVDDSAKVETKSGTLNQNGYQILCNGTEGRWSNNQWNIVNDQEANNTSAGVVRIPLADVKNMQVNSATFKMTVDTASGDSECNGLEVYYSTDYAKINGYIAGGQTNSVGCSSGAGTTANDSFATKLGFSRTGSLVATYPKSTTGERSFDIKSVMQSIVDTNADYLYLIVMQKNAGGKGSGSGWSDTKVKPTSLSITYNVQNKVMAKDEVQTKLNAFNDHAGWTGEYGSFNGDNQGDWKSGTGYTTYMRNVLYGQKSAEDNTSESGNSNSYNTRFGYPEMVLAYDGKTNLDTPILVAAWASGANRYLHSVANTNSQLTLVKNVWYGSDKNNNWCWLYSQEKSNDIGQIGTTTSNGKAARICNTSWIGGWNSIWYKWANMVRFNGSFGADEYIKTVYPSFQFYISGNSSATYNDKINRATTCNKAIYYVNFKKVIDLVATAKTDLNNLDPNKYTATSVQAYYDAIIALASYDITSAGGKISSNNVAGGAQTVANELKALVDNYNTAKAGLQKINTVTFHYTSNTKTDLVKKVLDGNTCTVPDDDSPAVIEKNNADTHKVTRYYWGPADAKITADVTYNEKTNVSYESHAWGKTATTVAPTCTEDGYTVYECSICGETSHQDLVDPTGHTYRPNQGSAVAPSNYTNGETYDAKKDYKHAINCIISASHTKKEESCDIGASWVAIDADTEKSTCSVCGGYITRAIIHGYDIVFKDVNGNVIATNPTMEGEMPSTPNLLNYAYIDEAGHHSFSWNKDIVVATEATEYQMVENALVPHAYADNYTRITAPTCYAEGLEADSCTVSRDCEYSKTRPIEKIAHTWGDWAYDEDQQKQYHTCTVEQCKYTEYDNCSFEITEEVKATCTAQGHTTYTCTECGGSYTEYSLPLGHVDPETLPLSNYVAETCTTEGYSGDKICTRCGTTIVEGHPVGALGHDIQVFTYKSTCTKGAYFTKTCSRGDTEAKEISMAGFEYSEYDPSGYAYVNWSGKKDDGYEEKYTLNIGIEIDHFEISYTSKADWYAGSGTKTRWKLFDGKGNEIENRKVNNTTYSDTKTIEGSSFTIQAVDFRVNEKVQVTSIKVYPKLPDGWTTADLTAKGHSFVKNDDFGNGLLGTHTCSVCGEATAEHNLDLKRSGNDIVVSCTTCDFSEVLHTTASTVTVTENNLFDTDKFINSHDATGTNKTSKGLACFRRTDGKVVVVGNDDNYTKHDRENDYLIPVEGGKTYQFDFDASTTYGDVMLFFRGAGNGYDSNYLNMRKSGTAIGKNTIEFTVPDGGKQLYIRVGTNSGDKNAYCVFSNFALHEKDDPNYTMIKDVPSGAAIDDYFTAGTADACYYNFKNSSIIHKDGDKATGTTVDRNANVVAVKEHTPVTDQAVELTCTQDGYTEGSHCSVCGYIITAQIKTDKLGHDMSVVVENENGVYTWYNTCSRGDVKEEIKSIDINAYYAAVAFANSEIANTAKYTEASRNALEDVVDSITLDLSATSEITQTDVENAATTITSAAKVKANAEDEIAVLELNSYTVRLYYVYDDVKDPELKVTESGLYGTPVNFDLGDDYVAEKWVRNTVDGDKIVGIKNKTLDITITGETDYYVHVKPANASEEANVATVFLRDKNDRVLGTAYLPVSDEAREVTVDGYSITIDNQTINAPKLAFYNISEFRVDNAIVGNSMVVNGDINLVAVYEPTEAKYSITTDETCTSNVSTAYWDQKVVVIAVDGNANTKWIVNGEVVGYGPTYTFRASTNVVISCENETEATPTATVLDLGYGSIREKTISAVCSYYVPEGWTVVETGALLKTSAVNDTSAVKDIANYTGSTANAKKFVATNVVKETNQFVINVSSSKEYTELHMGAVAYVTATKDGQTQTFYSSLATSDYTK